MGAFEYSKIRPRKKKITCQDSCNKFTRENVLLQIDKEIFCLQKDLENRVRWWSQEAFAWKAMIAELKIVKSDIEKLK